MRKYKSLIGEKEEAYLIQNFGKSFLEIANLPETEQEAIDQKLWYDLENDDQNHEASLISNRVLINWGRYEHGMIEEDE